MLRKISIIFIELSKLSYSIFLFQHQIISDILSLKNPMEWYLHLLLLSLTIILILICSKIHLMVVNSIIENFIFQNIESLFL